MGLLLPAQICVYKNINIFCELFCVYIYAANYIVIINDVGAYAYHFVSILMPRTIL